MQSLLEWCAGALGAEPDGDLALEPVAGDASFRRYYRLLGCSPTRIAVHAPPDTERNQEYVRVAGLLRAAGVNAPEVLACDMEKGYLLISDFGDRVLLGALDAGSVDALYRVALDTLLRIQCARTGAGGWTLPSYSRELLLQEMELFPTWHLGGLLAMEPGPDERALLDRTFEQLVASAAEQPQVFVHRDYHSRNLMLLDDGSLGVIDFQDAVVGPITYDLVSLLRDCYVAWPAKQVSTWASGYAALAAQAGLMAAVPAARFIRWFDWMGLQRHIKVLGIFARLWLRDGKRAYLSDLPLVIRYTLEVSELHPELAEFAGWFRDRVLPAAQRQDWYRPADPLR
jgi:aminoglycoside/choline kinase family phosphotransferase